MQISVTKFRKMDSSNCAKFWLPWATMSRRPLANHLPATHARELVELCERWNVETAELLDGLDLNEAQLMDPAGMVSIPTLEALINRARQLSGEEALGYYLGMRMRVSAHGYLGFAAMLASTVGEALDLAVRFARTRTETLSLRYETTGPSVALYIDERANFGAARDVVLITLAIGIWQIGSALTGRKLEGDAEFMFSQPEYYSRLAELTPPTRFSQQANRLIFDKNILSYPLKMADPSALILVREQCEQALRALDSTDEILSKVSALIPKEDQGFRSLEEVASALHMSPRTLKRRLSERGVAFTSLLEEQQREKAMHLLRDNNLTIDEVAERLGYSDTSNFARAFRRWTDMSPAAFRRSTKPRVL